MSLKYPVTPPGIDPGTVRLEAQRLNHYATPVPHYKLYCKILSRVIKFATKLYYVKIILNSKNKMETMRKIIKTETGKTNHKMGVQLLKISDTVTDKHVMIANTFNKYFISITDSIISIVRSVNNDHESTTEPFKYLFNSFN
jgi:hypothetical protein